MPEINISNFSRGIQTATGFIRGAQTGAASDIRNMKLNDLGRLIKELGRAHKNGSALDEAVLRVMPCYYLGGTLPDGSSGTARDQLIIQTTTKLKFWDGAAFTDLTLTPNGLTSGATFDWVVTDNRLFLANGNETLWVDITQATPLVRWWGITPNSDSGYTPSSMPTPQLSLMSGGALDANKWYGYAFTYYNSVWDIESLPSERAVVSPSGGNLTVAIKGMTVSDDPQITDKWIYRTDGQDSAIEAREAPLYRYRRIPDDATISSTATAGTTNNQIVDSTKNFENLEVITGQIADNSTSGVESVITGILGSVTTTVYFNTAGTHSSGDSYTIDFAEWADNGRIWGMATGGSATQLIDTRVNFNTLGPIVAGQSITNDTDTQSGTVTSVETTTNTNDTLNVVDLSGGSFDQDDEYFIDFTLATELEADHDNPPSTTKYLTEHAGRIWAGLDKSSVMLFSKVDGVGKSRYDAFPDTNAEIPHKLIINAEDGDFISALEPTPGAQGVTIFTENAVTFMRGSGLVSGLYGVSLATVDIDLSAVNRSAGCAAPFSVVTVGGGLILFLGMDRQIWAVGGSTMEPISAPVQTFLDDIPQSRISQPVGWRHENCYMLSVPSGDNANDLVLHYDYRRNYWRIHDWPIADAHWATGGSDNGVLYGGLEGTNFVDTLFSGTDHAGTAFDAVWQSNWIQLPTFSVIRGVIVNSMTDAIQVKVRLDTDGVNGTERAYVPSKGNRYRIGTFGRGRTFRVRLSGVEFDQIERIAIEYQPIGG